MTENNESKEIYLDSGRPDRLLIDRATGQLRTRKYVANRKMANKNVEIIKVKKITNEPGTE